MTNLPQMRLIIAALKVSSTPRHGFSAVMSLFAAVNKFSGPPSSEGPQNSQYPYKESVSGRCDCGAAELISAVTSRTIQAKARSGRDQAKTRLRQEKTDNLR